MLMAIAGCPGAAPPVRETAPEFIDFAPTGTLDSERTFQDYQVRIYREQDSGKGSFEILRNGGRVYGHRGWQFQIGDINEISGKEKNRLIGMGQDITGNGEPDLVISEWTGGAHCCFIYFIFEIGKEFRPIGAIKAAYGDIDFRDLDGDSGLEIVINDWTFAYWRASFADSPAPKVVLRYRDGTYRLAADLMRKPAPALQQLKKQAQQIRESDAWKRGEVPSALWRVMLDLIYSGQAGRAWRFLEMAWRPHVQGKREFLRDFRSQLSTSPYWSEVKALSID